MGAIGDDQIVKEPSQIEASSRDRSRIETSRLVSLGPEGLEPSPTWLRARHAAANTLVPRARLGSPHLNRSFGSVVRGGIEPPPATYQIAMLPLQHRTFGRVGVEPTISCSQGTRGAVPLPPVGLTSREQHLWAWNQHFPFHGRFSGAARRTNRACFFQRAQQKSSASRVTPSFGRSEALEGHMSQSRWSRQITHQHGSRRVRFGRERPRREASGGK